MNYVSGVPVKASEVALEMEALVRQCLECLSAVDLVVIWELW